MVDQHVPTPFLLTHYNRTLFQVFAVMTKRPILERDCIEMGDKSWILLLFLSAGGNISKIFIYRVRQHIF